MNRFNFDVYTNEFNIEKIIPNDPHLKNIMRRIHKRKSLYECFNQLINSKNAICIGHEGAIYQINKLNKYYDHPVVKVAKPSLFSGSLQFYMFEKASPYGDKFGKILRRTQETSLDSMEFLTRDSEVSIEIEDTKIKFDDGIDVKQLLLILSCGDFLAILMFFAEFIAFKFFRQLLTR